MANNYLESAMEKEMSVHEKIDRIIDEAEKNPSFLKFLINHNNKRMEEVLGEKDFMSPISTDGRSPTVKEES